MASKEEREQAALERNVMHNIEDKELDQEFAEKDLFVVYKN